MLTHLVLFRFPDAATAEEAVRQIRRLPDMVPEVMTCHAGLNVTTDRRAFDVGMVMTFADEAAFARYDAHPQHMPVAEWIDGQATDIAAADFLT